MRSENLFVEMSAERCCRLDFRCALPICSVPQKNNVRWQGPLLCPVHQHCAHEALVLIGAWLVWNSWKLLANLADPEKNLNFCLTCCLQEANCILCALCGVNLHKEATSEATSYIQQAKKLGASFKENLSVLRVSCCWRWQEYSAYVSLILPTNLFKL